MTATFNRHRQTDDTGSRRRTADASSGPPTRAGPASTRDYTAEDVVRLRGSVLEEHTLARRGAERLWKQLTEEHTEDRSPARSAR